MIYTLIRNTKHNNKMTRLKCMKLMVSVLDNGSRGKLIFSFFRPLNNFNLSEIVP